MRQTDKKILFDTFMIFIMPFILVLGLCIFIQFVANSNLTNNIKTIIQK